MNTPISNKAPKSRVSTTPYDRRGSSSACFKPFKSPVSNKSPVEDNRTLVQDIAALRSDIEKVEKEITELKSENYCESELQVYIDRLHEYNEIKDIAQMVIGKIAEIEGTTSRLLYSRFDLDIDD
ncbi:DNA repair protein SWI5 homolog [Hydra vulgaris]|uniref:DNA repair protein SWI5 homolog n=1 Tax=Hydra vulgaris TaxID=6087 RepID=UPI0002B483C4|nr:DNA repair protein SWI5 homolog [Hydra vulgaris]